MGYILYEQNGDFTSTQACKIAKVSLRQLQWWDETRIIIPQHVSHRRIYSFEDMLLILTIMTLKYKGITFPKIRKMARSIKRSLAGRSTFLVTDGQRVRACSTGEQVIEILRHNSSPVVMVPVAELRDHLHTMLPWRGSIRHSPKADY